MISYFAVIFSPIVVLVVLANLSSLRRKRRGVALAFGLAWLFSFVASAVPLHDPEGYSTTLGVRGLSAFAIASLLSLLIVAIVLETTTNWALRPRFASGLVVGVLTIPVHVVVQLYIACVIGIGCI